MHAFAHLAPAPYRLVSVVKSADEIKAGRSAVLAQCAHCGAQISNVATFKGADGRDFAVGLDCARKAGESVVEHAKAAKGAEVIAKARAVLPGYALSLRLSGGAFIDDRSVKPSTLLRDFKPLARMGLCVISRRRNRFGEVCETRVTFTQAGAGALPGVIPGTPPEGEGWVS